MKPHFLLMVRVKHLYWVTCSSHIWLSLSETKSHFRIRLTSWTAGYKTPWGDIFRLRMMSIHIISIIKIFQSQRTHTWISIFPMMEMSWLIQIYLVFIIHKKRSRWFKSVFFSIIFRIRLNFMDVNVKIVLSILLILQAILIYLVEHLRSHA